MQDPAQDRPEPERGEHVEREVKLDPAPDFDVSRLGQQLGDVTVSAPSLIRLHTVYYDTADLRLTRAGFNLRYRWDEGWTLKTPFDPDELGATRTELAYPGDASTPPSDALDLLRGVVRDRPVAPIAELRTLRRRTRIDDIAEVTDDDVRVVRDGRIVDRFRQAEVEALSGSDVEAFDALVGRLQAIGAGEVVWEPKLQRALGMPVPGSARGVDSDAPAEALLRFALETRFTDLLRYDFLIRSRCEAEDVHRARSSLRKLRAVLRGFRRSLDRMWTDTLREEMRWMANELATVRDLDVVLASLESHASEVDGPDTPYVAKTLDPLAETRDAARRGLLATMNDRRYLELLDRIDAAAAKPALLDGCPPTAAEIAAETLHRISKRARKAIRMAHSGDALGELHHARIQVRNGRYTAEACSAVIGKPAKRLAKRLKRIQDLLGTINDASMAQERLRATVGDARVPLVAGQLLALEAFEGRRARTTWKRLRHHALARSLGEAIGNRARLWPCIGSFLELLIEQ